MSDSFSELIQRAEQYAKVYNYEFLDQLGRGNDGHVWRTSHGSALKVFHREETYLRERDCYRRLFERRIEQVAGFIVPELLDYHNRLLVVEMSLVLPPCVLDFGKSYLDRPADYPPELMAEVEEAEKELFEPEQWRQVLRVRGSLRLVGIYYYDIKPTNIIFPPIPGELFT